MDIPFVELLHFIEQIRVVKHFWFFEDFVAVASAKNNRPAEGRHTMGDLCIRIIAATATLGQALDGQVPPFLLVGLSPLNSEGDGLLPLRFWKIRLSAAFSRPATG